MDDFIQINMMMGFYLIREAHVCNTFRIPVPSERDDDRLYDLHSSEDVSCETEWMWCELEQFLVYLFDYVETDIKKLLLNQRRH